MWFTTQETVQNTKRPSKRIIRKKKSTAALITGLIMTCFSDATAIKEKINPYELSFCKEQAQKKLLTPGKKVKKIFFVPDEDVKILLLGLIHMSKAKTKIRIAVYQLTDKDIVDALIAAHKRGVSLEIIVDQSCLYNRYEKISALRRLNIPIHVYGGKYYSIMHNKFFIFENTLNNKSIVFTGSANATLGGTTRNEENVWIIENKKIIDQYTKKFDTLKQKISLMPFPKTKKLNIPQKIYKQMLQKINTIIGLLGVFNKAT